MNGTLNESIVVEEHEFDKQLIHKIDFINVNCIRDCQNKYFHI